MLLLVVLALNASLVSQASLGFYGVLRPVALSLSC